MHNLSGKWETKRHSMDIHCCYEYVVPNKKDSCDAINDKLHVDLADTITLEKC